MTHDQSRNVPVGEIQSPRDVEENGQTERHQGVLQALPARTSPSPVHCGYVTGPVGLVRFDFLGYVAVSRGQVAHGYHGMDGGHGRELVHRC